MSVQRCCRTRLPPTRRRSAVQELARCQSSNDPQMTSSQSAVHTRWAPLPLLRHCFWLLQRFHLPLYRNDRVVIHVHHTDHPYSTLHIITAHTYPAAMYHTRIQLRPCSALYSQMFHQQSSLTLASMTSAYIRTHPTFIHTVDQLSSVALVIELFMHSTSDSLYELH